MKPVQHSESEFESESSDDEDEDEFGDLVTEDVEEGINKVLQTIRENPTALLNKDVKFFNETNSQGPAKASSDKPVYLKDYHRMNLLSGEADDCEKPFAIQQKEDKERLVAEIHGALNGDEESGDDEDDDFLTKRKEEREVAPLDLPDPNADDGKFLQAFLDNKAWLPSTVDKKTGKPVLPSYGEIIEDDEEFDDNADQFENAYNFRFEDPNAAEIVSYARNQNTLRRSAESSRKKQRESKKAVIREKEEKREAEITKIKNKKVKEVMSKFEQLKKVLGDDAESEALSKILSEQDLDGDFEGDAWDKKMQEVFNEEFYAQQDHKPKWDKDSGDEFEGEGEEHEEQAEDIEMDEAAAEGEQEQEQPKVSKAQQKRDEKKRKREEQQEIKTKAQKLVEENIDLLLEKEASHLLKKDEDDDMPKFKYREVSPEAFGLSARDILLANDQDLNEFVGLKKLATFRDPEKKKKDHRKYAKKRRLREWRKSVFNNEDEPDDEAVISALQGSGSGKGSSGPKKGGDKAKNDSKQKRSNKKQRRN